MEAGTQSGCRLSRRLKVGTTDEYEKVASRRKINITYKWLHAREIARRATIIDPQLFRGQSRGLLARRHVSGNQKARRALCHHRQRGKYDFRLARCGGNTRFYVSPIRRTTQSFGKKIQRHAF